MRWRWMLGAAVAGLFCVADAWAWNTSKDVGFHRCCTQWTWGRANNVAGEMEQWALGFPEAFVAYAYNTGDQRASDLLFSIEQTEIWGWIDSYCFNHPDNSLSDAVLYFHIKRLPRLPPG